MQQIDDLPAAASKADVIVTVIGAKDPLIKAEWIRSGQHITFVGSDDTTKREIDPAILKGAYVYVDALCSALNYGAPSRAIAENIISENTLREIGSALDA